jgi:hypothetical protein
VASTIDTLTIDCGAGWPLLFFVVPEGNEFCVLRGPEDGWAPDA